MSDRSSNEIGGSTNSRPCTEPTTLAVNPTEEQLRELSEQTSQLLSKDTHEAQIFASTMYDFWTDPRKIRDNTTRKAEYNRYVRAQHDYPTANEQRTELCKSLGVDPQALDKREMSSVMTVITGTDAECVWWQSELQQVT